MSLPETFASEKISKTQNINVALVGNPNTGKSSLFNALTGMRQKIGNYPGVTVEKKTGRINHDKLNIQIHDLPGLYSLIPKSLDDKIPIDILLGQDNTMELQLILVVADASNLNRNLYLVSQLLDLDIPVILALNMMDVARKNDIRIDIKGLESSFGIPVIPVVANKKEGINELKQALFDVISGANTIKPKRLVIPDNIKESLSPLIKLIRDGMSDQLTTAKALRYISSETYANFWLNENEDETEREILESCILAIRDKLVQNDTHWSMLETKLRYEWIDSIARRYVEIKPPSGDSINDKFDKVLTHRIAGPIIFLAVFAVIFQTIFTWAEIPMTAIEDGINWLGIQIGHVLPEGILKDMIVDGAIAGVGSILVFLPQILFLFFFLSLLEDTGYMARVAFMLDRVMRLMGLSGRSVIPLLSSFACAIPGIMATRTIPTWKDRLVTIMIAPFMSCSARLPVYILMIGAFIPKGVLWGFVAYSTIAMIAMYTIGILAAVFVAFIFKSFLLKSQPASDGFIMELPQYHRPSLRWTALQMFERAKVFVQDAGKIILAMSIVLWFMATYPKADSTKDLTPSQQISESFAGQIGKFIEPAIVPLGFDWKIGIGLLTSFAAREVMVSTMATIYNVEGGDETSVNLRTALKNDKDPQTGKNIYSSLTAVSLMVFFVLACQCMATVAIVKRETNSWFWPVIMVTYMTALAYLGSLIVYQGGLALGFN
jgi:ferrous iron transport protein B